MWFAYFLGGLMLIGVIVLLSSLFWKNKTGKEMRESCFAYVALLAVALLIAYLISKCTN